MKKLLVFIMLSCLMMGNAMAQISTSSRFLDNISATIEVNDMTSMKNAFVHNSPTIGLMVDKGINSWLIVGIDARTAIAAPSGSLNPHTAFDAVNVGASLKCDFTNLFAYNGSQKPLSVIGYVNCGWGHKTCKGVHEDGKNHAPYPWDWQGENYQEDGVKGERNYGVFRTGLEWVIKVSEPFSIVANTSVCWGNIRDFKLNANRGNIELGLGARWRFKNQDKTRTWHYEESVPIKTRYVEVHKTDTVVVNKVITKYAVDKVFVTFANNSSELTESAKKVLDSINANGVKIEGYASPEGNSSHNLELSQDRADAVADYLSGRGIKILSSLGMGSKNDTSQRIAIIYLK